MRFYEPSGEKFWAEGVADAKKFTMELNFDVCGEFGKAASLCGCGEPKNFSIFSSKIRPLGELHAKKFTQSGNFSSLRLKNAPGVVLPVK